MQKTFGQLLQTMFSDYSHTENMTITASAYCTTNENLDKLTKCCRQFGYPNFTKKDIETFINNLFSVDPCGLSLKVNQDDSCNKNTNIVYKEPDAPYDYGVIDTDKFDLPYDNGKPKKSDRYQAMPKCEKCSKLAYFGLPFCPWCMKQIPPFYPKTNEGKQHILNANTEQDIAPMVSLSVIKQRAKELEKSNTMVSMVVGGIEKSFKDTDVFFEDKDDEIRITYGDIERERKTISKFIPE